MIDVEREMVYRLDVAGPLESPDDPARAPRVQFWQMSRATLAGPRIKAESAMPGIDWFTPLPEGYGRPHVRLAFRTDDDAIVLMEYRGIVHASKAFLAAVEQDKPTEWGDQYMRMALGFETASPRYQWLTRSLFLARGRLLGAKSLEYEVYRVN